VPQRRILVGVVGRPHGVRGLVRVHSYTAEPTDLARYAPLEDARGRRFTLRWRGEGIAELAELVEGKPVPLANREEAAKLVNARLYVDRERLPDAETDEFYHADLIGMAAVDESGREVGRVEAVHDYGAGASLQIGPLLLPFTRACVPQIDLAAGRLTVAAPAEVVAAETGGAEGGGAPA
jgi:16S rRNA processing protein RimM